MEHSSSLRLRLLPGTFAVCRLEPGSVYPTTPRQSQFWSLTVTPGEISLVCEETLVPSQSQVESGWRALEVPGPLEFSQVGVLAGLSAPLAAASISIFVTSTFDTDYLFVKDENLSRAISVLTEAGYSIDQSTETGAH